MPTNGGQAERRYGYTEACHIGRIKPHDAGYQKTEPSVACEREPNDEPTYQKEQRYAKGGGRERIGVSQCAHVGRRGRGGRERWEVSH
jgi:hypothetical protein